MRIALILLIVLAGLSACRTVTEEEMAQRLSRIDDALGRSPTTGVPRRPSQAVPLGENEAASKSAALRTEEARRVPRPPGPVAVAPVDPAEKGPSKLVAPSGFAIMNFDVDGEKHAVLVPDGYCNLFAATRPLPTRLVKRVTGNSGGRFHPDMIAMPCDDIYTAGARGQPTSFIFFVRSADGGVPINYELRTRDRDFFPDRFDQLIDSSRAGLEPQWRAIGAFMQSVSFPPDIISGDVRFDGETLSFVGLSRFQVRGELRRFRLDASTFRIGAYFATIGVTTEVEAGREVIVPITSDQIRRSLSAVR